MTWRRVGWASVVLLGAVGVLSWWTGHAPVALLAASYVALLGLLARALPVRVAVSAAFVAQQALLLALELVVPLFAGGPLRPGVALGMLLVPCLAVVPDVLLRGGGDRLRVRWSLLAAGVGAVVLVAVVRGQVAWTASGDARNHYLFTRLVLAQGGLEDEALSFQPLHQEALTALLVDTHGRGTLAPGALLEHDLRALALTSLALAVAWTLASTATLWALRDRPHWAAVAAASLLPVAGIGLGVLLRDGFLSILVLAPLLLCTLSVLAWLATTKRTGIGVTVAVGITAAAVPLAAFTWTPHAIVVGAAALVPWRRALLSREHHRVRLALMVAGATTGAAYFVYVVSQAAGRLVDAPGSIAAPSPVVVAVVPVLVLVIAVARLSSAPEAVFVPYLVGSLAAAALTVEFVITQPDGQAWNYFPAKFAWVWLLVGLPLLLVPLAHSRTAKAWLPLVGVLGVLVVLGPIGSPLTRIHDWSKPSAGSLDLAVELGAPSERYVVYEVRPTEDRLTNFWLVAYDGETGPTRDNPFFVWAYHETGSVADICSLLADEPDRIVATGDPLARTDLRDACGREVRVRIVDGDDDQDA